MAFLHTHRRRHVKVLGLCLFRLKSAGRELLFLIVLGGGGGGEPLFQAIKQNLNCKKEDVEHTIPAFG